ncbi:MAG TPA: hypothetical protein VGI17_05690 [Solirubrobacterales bacterium]|jgi:type I restriction enzyme S subunit
MTLLGGLVEINPRERPSAPAQTFIAVADIDVELAVAHPREAAGDASSHQVARPGDILFARISPSMENGKVAIVPDLPTGEALVSNELVVLRPKPGVDPRLVWAFLRQRRVRNALKRFLVGSTGRQRLRSEALEKLEISVPAERDWDSRVAALEHLDQARRLRRTWIGRVRSLPGLAATTIAAGAPSDPLGSLDLDLRTGTSEPSDPEGRPMHVLGPANLIEGRVDRTAARSISPLPGRSVDQLRRGDLLFVRTSFRRGRVGRCAIYEEEGGSATYSASLLRLRSPEHDPWFLWAWFQSATAKAELAKAGHRGSSRYRLSVSGMGRVAVPRLPRSGEARIGDVARSARRLTTAGEAQAALLEHLVQALLAATFHDSAIDQVPDIEPRIAAVVDFLPHVFEVASRRQQELWRRVSELDDRFGLPDLARGEADHARVQHCLAIFEQLGLVVRESAEESYRWRQPDLELEVLD